MVSYYFIYNFLFLGKNRTMHHFLRFALFSVFFLVVKGLFAQDSSQVAAPKRYGSDLIATVTGDTLLVNIKKITSDYVSFSLKGERFKQKLQKSAISTVVFKDGRVEDFNNPIIVRKESEGAAKIKVTNSEEDVFVLKEIATVEGQYVGSIRNLYSDDFLKKMAIINLKEVAFRNDPRVKVLLIKKVSITRAFGEDPSAVVTATAYTR